MYIVGELPRDFSESAYGEAAALRYHIVESGPAGFALHIAPHVWRFLEELGGVAKHRRVLDLGCGTGDLAGYLLERGAWVTGLDRSPHMLSYANETNAAHVDSGRAHFVEGDATNFRFDEQFELVICTFNTLNHLADFGEVERCLSSIAKALAPGGSLLCDIDTRLGLENVVATNSIDDSDHEIILRKRISVDGRVVLYASGCFFHEDLWHRYRETITKIPIDTEDLRRALGMTGFSEITFTSEDFSTPVEDPEAGERAYVAAQKPAR